MKNGERESGIVLVVTLWVIVVLSTVALAYVRQVNLEVKMLGFQRDAMIADSVAKAGLRQALILLREDKIKDRGEDVKETITHFLDDDAYEYDGGNESWASRDENSYLFVDFPFYETEDRDGYYYVQVEDESSKFPINNMQTSLDMIAHLLELTGVKEDEAKTLAAAVIDWRDPDDVPTDTGSRSFGGDTTSEYEFYNSGRQSRRQNIPEVIVKNGPLDSIDELLLIPGMTPQIVFGTVDPEDRESRGRSRRRRRGRNEYLGLKNYVTVYSYRVNLNTVKNEVLEAILYGAAGTEAESLAEEWTDYRDGNDRETYTHDDKVMKTIDNSDMDDVHYTEVKGFTPELMKTVGPFFAVASDTFLVTCLAEYRDIEKGYRVVVGREYIPWQQLPQFGYDTNDVEDLEQSKIQVRLFEPIFDAKKKIEQML